MRDIMGVLVLGFRSNMYVEEAILDSGKNVPLIKEVIRINGSISGL